MRAAFFAVMALAAAFLFVRAVRVELAGDYVDPILRIRAQDESLHAHSAIQMARSGDWSTPRFLGRFSLSQPPFLVWTAAAAGHTFGLARAALRAPVVLMVAFAVALIFLWGAELQSWEAGAAAALLVCANHLWHVAGSMVLPDGLLAALSVMALYCLYSDPWLKSPWWMAGFSAAVAAAILTKGVAGVLPLAVLVVYGIAAPESRRPKPWRIVLAGVVAIVLAAPWFLYQVKAHGRWFQTEHFGLELFQFSAAAASQMSRANQWKFFFARLTSTDPTLLALTLLALPGLIKAVRRREADAILLAVWAGISVVVAVVWSYRNASYLLPAIPAVALMAAVYSPLSTTSRRTWLPALATLALLVKAALPALPWGISFKGGTVGPQSVALAQYCQMGRGNELILYGFDDDMYASVLPLPHIRYELLSPSAKIDSSRGLPLGWMGITMEASQFNDLARWEPIYGERLREWGLNSSAPIGSLLVARSAAELADVVRRHPRTDFFLPEYLHPAVLDLGQTHDEVSRGDHFFLFARDRLPRPTPPEWTCEM